MHLLCGPGAVKSNKMDDGPPLLHYILLVILLIFSFFFSGSETAIFSLNRLERNSLKKSKSKNGRNIIQFLLENHEQLLITILTGNMVVNIFASSVGSIIGAHIFNGKSDLFSIIGMTIILLMAGELTPKRLAVNHPKAFTRLASVPLYYLHIILSPVRAGLNYITRRVLVKFSENIGENREDRHALVLSTAELGFNESILKQSEYRLFKSYLTFKDKTAHSVMTPRSELKTIPWNISIGEVVGLIAAEPDYIINSSLILFKEDNDHLYGWVPVFDLLSRKIQNKDMDLEIGTLAEKFISVPESKDLNRLIAELREADTDIVQLVDEYGGTAGIIWFRNIIEDVLKAFYTPYKETFNDTPESVEIIPGNMAIEELEEFLGMEIITDADTAAGLFMEKHGDIPEINDVITCSHINFKVIRMDGNKIELLSVEERDKQ